MSAHFTHRRSTADSPYVSFTHQSPTHHHHPHTIRSTNIPQPTSAFEITMLLLAILLMAGLIIFLIWSCLHSFEWFRRMTDPQARFRYNAERAERAGLWASGQGGAFVRAAERSAERQLLCDRSAYLGGGRGYGWRNRGYGDGSADETKVGLAEGRDGDSGYGSIWSPEQGGWVRRGSDSSGRSVKHRDDCEGECGLTERRGSRPSEVGV